MLSPRGDRSENSDVNNDVMALQSSLRQRTKASPRTGPQRFTALTASSKRLLERTPIITDQVNVTVCHLSQTRSRLLHRCRVQSGMWNVKALPWWFAAVRSPVNDGVGGIRFVVPGIR